MDGGFESSVASSTGRTSREPPKIVARLFYPILFSATAALLAALWAKQWLPAQWLSGFGVAQAQAQSADADPRATPRVNPNEPRPPGPVPRYSDDPRRARQAAAAPSGPAPQAFQPQASPPRGAQLRIPAPGMQPPAGQTPPNGRPQEQPAGNAPIPFENAKVIARIGAKEHILLGDVIAEVEKEFAKQAPKYNPRDHETLKQMLIHQQLRQMIPMRVLAIEARKMIPDDKLPEVMKQVDGIFRQQVLPAMMKDKKVDSVEAFEAKLKAEGSSLKQLTETFVDTQLVQQYLADHTEVDKNVSPSELYAYYRAHYDEYKYEAKVRWEQLLVKFNRRSKQEALQILADMGNQVLHGAPWDVVAKARSEGFTATDGGVHDWTTKGSLKFKTLDAALFTLPIGAMSRILEDENSVQIVRVIDRREAGVVSFEEAQNDIKNLIVEERTKAKKNEFVKSVLDKHRSSIWTIFDEQQAAAGNEQQRERESAVQRQAGRVQR